MGAGSSVSKPTVVTAPTRVLPKGRFKCRIGCDGAGKIKWKTTGADIAEPNWELNFIVEHSGDVHGSTKQEPQRAKFDDGHKNRYWGRITLLASGARTFSGQVKRLKGGAVGKAGTCWGPVKVKVLDDQEIHDPSSWLIPQGQMLQFQQQQHPFQMHQQFSPQQFAAHPQMQLQQQQPFPLYPPLCPPSGQPQIVMGIPCQAAAPGYQHQQPSNPQKPGYFQGAAQIEPEATAPEISEISNGMDDELKKPAQDTMEKLPQDKSDFSSDDLKDRPNQKCNV